MLNVMKSKYIGTCLYVTLLVIFLTPTKLLGGQNAPAGTPNPGGFAAILILILYICYRNRIKAIGGWLLYYFISLFWSFGLFLLTTIMALPNYQPSNWPSTGTFLLWLLTVIPADIILLVQVILSFWLIPKTRRDWRLIKFLRLLLVLDIGLALLSIFIDFLNWPQDIFFDIIGLIWPMIWLPYFLMSKRVKAVYLHNNWASIDTASRL